MNKRGIDCEQLAIKYFLSRRFKLLGQRVKVRHVEVDLLMTKNNSLYVIEVKSGLHDFEYLQARVTSTQRQRLQRVVEYLSLRFNKDIYCYLCVIDDKGRVQVFGDWLCH